MNTECPDPSGSRRSVDRFLWLKHGARQVWELLNMMMKFFYQSNSPKGFSRRLKLKSLQAEG
jgi:hypothetical protein